MISRFYIFIENSFGMLKTPEPIDLASYPRNRAASFCKHYLLLVDLKLFQNVSCVPCISHLN